MKIGIDIHGVITKAPIFFSLISKLLVESGNEVFIITGASITKKITNKLKKYNIHYTTLLSVTDYLISEGNNVHFESEDNPWFDEDVWNKAKSVLCKKNNIDFHIDDSEFYGNFFETPYAKINIINPNIKK